MTNGCESALVMTQTSNVEDRQISAKLHRVATSAKVYLVYFTEQISYQDSFLCDDPDRDH